MPLWVPTKLVRVEKKHIPDKFYLNIDVRGCYLSGKKLANEIFSRSKKTGFQFVSTAETD